MESRKKGKQEERRDSPRHDHCVRTRVCVRTHPAADLGEISIPSTGSSIQDCKENEQGNGIHFYIKHARVLS